MAKKMNLITPVLLAATVFCTVWYHYTAIDLARTLAISFGTTAYHFVMRLIVGQTVNLLFHNHMNYQARWFQVSKAEQKLYKKLKVKRWKNHMPTYNPQCFDSTIHSWEEIAQAMCQAEVVHEIIAVLSFLPILAAIPFGTLPVFVITSVLAACVDTTFVMMQRYNRPRIVKLIKKV